MKTKVINLSSDTIVLKEGTQNIFREISKLNPGGYYNIKVDPNSTYREYWCAAKDNDPKAIILSSDDCQDHRTIEIFCEGGTYKWRSVKVTEASGSGEVRKKGLIAVLWEKVTGGARSN